MNLALRLDKKVFAWLMAAAWLSLTASSQTLPLQFGTALFNQLDLRGFPLSTTNGNPPGSNGKAPTTAYQTALHLPIESPTREQFQSHISLGGVAPSVQPDLVVVLNAQVSGLPTWLSDNTDLSRVSALRLGDGWNRNLNSDPIGRTNYWVGQSGFLTTALNNLRAAFAVDPTLRRLLNHPAVYDFIADERRISPFAAVASDGAMSTVVSNPGLLNSYLHLMATPLELAGVRDPAVLNAALYFPARIVLPNFFPGLTQAQINEGLALLTDSRLLTYLRNPGYYSAILTIVNDPARQTKLSQVTGRSSQVNFLQDSQLLAELRATILDKILNNPTFVNFLPNDLFNLTVALGDPILGMGLLRLQSDLPRLLPSLSGGVSGLKVGSSLVQNAAVVGLPTGGSGANAVTMTFARVGATYISQATTYLMGSIIPVPTVDYTGKTNLTDLAGSPQPENYWLAEPFTTNNHATDRFYWSPNKGAVFATQPGQVSITWKRSFPLAGTPSDASNAAKYYRSLAGQYFPLLTVPYIVSGSPIKTPRTIYWTEGDYASTGVYVDVPVGLAPNGIHIAYNDGFPQYVDHEVGKPPITAGSQLQYEITNTLWLDPQIHAIRAYNASGRVFVEFLGDANSDGQSFKHLGFELVDIKKTPIPQDVTNDLGEVLTAWPGGETPSGRLDDAALLPKKPISLDLSKYVMRRDPASGAGRTKFYAIGETLTPNTVLLHWFESGLLGLRWPYLFDRYTLRWPLDPSAYSHFVRPLVATPTDAAQTAIQLPSLNAPSIIYQDPFTGPRAFMTPDFHFYTFVDLAVPIHRTLLMYQVESSIYFERIYSWLDVALKTNALGSANGLLSGTAVTNLNGWDGVARVVNFPNASTGPRVVTQTATVGRRISPPDGENGDGQGSRTNYMAGYIYQPVGTSFSPTAYLSPLAADGFTAANKGSIIPVNAIPGNNQLEVWWFRNSTPPLTNGFIPVSWPEVVGYYTLQWPMDSSEIVLASNDGSGPLPSLEAKGKIYIQNDSTANGYNPNEEHALLQAGQVYALRDDLNITSTNELMPYSSQPFVLLEYTDSDGRPSQRAFKVRREAPEKGETFDYAVTAGGVLQPPMPLPLLEKPLAPRKIGIQPQTLNTETSSWVVQSAAIQEPNVPYVDLTLDHPALMHLYQTLAFQDLSGYAYFDGWFTAHNEVLPNGWIFPVSANPEAKTVHGVPSAVAPLDLTLAPSPQATDLAAGRNIYGIPSTDNLSVGMKVIVADKNGQTNALATVADLQTGIGAIPQVTVQFNFLNTDAWTNATTLIIPDRLPSGQKFNGWTLSTEAISTALPLGSVRDLYSSFTLKDRKGNQWVYRGPHTTNGTPYTVMQFYYKTLPGFYYPNLRADKQPPVGTVTPYLRPLDANGVPQGEAVQGHASLQAQTGGGNSLGIYYHPVWPVDAPVLQMAETLTVPKRGLPAVRGQTSLGILYQQSEYLGGTAKPTVVLHDPTRARVFLFRSNPDSTTFLGKIPSSARTQQYQGKTYFPALPPHLSDRFYFDPNLGRYGGLSFVGSFQDDIVGDKYLLLNVASPSDLDALTKLVDAADPLFGVWQTTLKQSLTTDLQRFVENPAKPGTFTPELNTVSTKNATQLAEVTDQDVAVDSYALTAMGPGTGYVTLIAGNGLAFTPTDDPVSVQVLRVDKALYKGEVKIVQSSNPLGEKLSLQQVVDLAGKTDQYEFDWRIAPPVDGSAPPVYLRTPTTLVSSRSTWYHLQDRLPSDSLATLAAAVAANPQRFIPDVVGSVVPFPTIPFNGVTHPDTDHLRFQLGAAQSHTLLPGNLVQVLYADGAFLNGMVTTDTTAKEVVVLLESFQTPPVDILLPVTLVPRVPSGQPATLLYQDFTVSAATVLSDVWLSLSLDDSLGAQVYLDGQPLAAVNFGQQSTAESTPPADLNPLGHAYRLTPSVLLSGTPVNGGLVSHRLAVVIYSGAAPDARVPFDLKLEGHLASDQVLAVGSQWLPLDPVRYPDGVRAILGGTADVRALSDNYLVMRYRATNPRHASYVAGDGWSSWTDPVLAEGWIKRVLAGINPFNQRVTDLFNNKINTDASILTSAGHRWEGDVALNLDSINNYGLIEIYETVLRRGKILSVDGGINYGPANDALLLAAGYISDLYKLVGDEAWADANNPTISIGSKDVTYGQVATSLFPFMGQAATLMEEQQDMLRGRDDFSAPGVSIAPVYNRLYWNYTRGISSGEVIYALNYDIQPNPNVPLTGSISAADAAHLYPQGHGDAYGHYLTSITGYYSLLMNPNFSWIPQAEAVNVLGVPVLVNYQHERKFASGASALGQAGLLALKLTTKADYVPGHDDGWESLMDTRQNPQTGRTRYWGADHWANRTAQGTFLNWVVGNSLLPAVDPDPGHQGVQKVDRTTVVELQRLPITGSEVQTVLDNAEGGLNPLGLPDNAVAFDINPTLVTGGTTHFEQVYTRAVAALANASASFDDAAGVTRLMRSQKDSVADYQASVDSQERSYTNMLIEIYGTPYADDIGPGKTYVQGYNGPDLLHYTYVDNTDLVQNNYPTTAYNPGDPQTSRTFKVDRQMLPANWFTDSLQTYESSLNIVRSSDADYVSGTHFIAYELGPRGFTDKPSQWQGRRQSPGQLQQAISAVNAAYDALRSSLTDAEVNKKLLDRAFQLYEAKVLAISLVYGTKVAQLVTDRVTATAKYALDITSKTMELTKSVSAQQAEVFQKALPKSTIFGLAFGGDVTSIAGAAVQEAFDIEEAVVDTVKLGLQTANLSLTLANDYIVKAADVLVIGSTQLDLDLKNSLAEVAAKTLVLKNDLVSISAKTRAYDDSLRAYRALLAKGDRLQLERQNYRLRAATVVQGYRTRDAALRLFRNEKLERYNALFDLSSTYSLLAAQAYDYETGLLNTDKGRSFLRRIVSSRAIGVFAGGNPQFGGSNSGDPGLSSALAEMKADWDVLKGRLGFSNPDNYGTIASLRTEKHRILPGRDGAKAWSDLLSHSRMENILDDPDVRRYCLQIDPGGGLAVPGLVLTFATTINKGLDVFGNPAAGGDHSFPSTAFATKVFAVGVSFEGYIGMDGPSANGGTSGDPVAYLNPNALVANPEVYLIPVGVDSMRSPPLGDTSNVRTWNIADIAVPVPFNIGGSDFSTRALWQSSQSLTEPLFSERKHPAFRPVGASSVFQNSVLSGAGSLQRSQYTSSRLIGRSVWNSKWKIVIPGNTLLNDPNEGLDRFIRTVSDVRILFQTYSYSGN